MAREATEGEGTSGGAGASAGPVLVTGGAGFIGSAVVRRLVGMGRRVVTVDRLTYAGHLASLGDALDAPHHAFERADVADPAAMADVFARHRPAAVLHLAAESHVDRSIDGAAEFVRTNVVGTTTLLDAARDHWKTLPPAEAAAFRFLHVSTDEVFGSLGDDGAFDEGTRYDPSSPYAASKAAADHFARAWHRTYGLPVLLTNCSNNYGPYQYPEKLIPLAIRRAAEGETIPVYGTGENVRDWLHVEDHVDALLLVLERGRVGETYLVGGGGERRNLDVVRAICAALDALAPDPMIPDRTALVRHVTDRPGHDHRYAVDSTHLRSTLGWRPRHTFEQGIRETVAWYLANPAWCERVLGESYRGERLGLGA